MNFLDCLSSAVDAALTWDMPEEGFAEAVHSHACLLAGISPDDMLWHYSND